ncbi:MAG: hypothetical protein WD063_14570 [Pirellulales bacterium]
MSDRPIEGDDAAERRPAVEQQRHEQLLEALGQLKSVVEEQLASIHDLLEHVAEVVREAFEEIGVLRDAIDEEKEVIEWAAHNGKRIFQLTSMPRDPVDPTWSQHLNKFTRACLPKAPDRPTAARQRAQPLARREALIV